MTTPLNRATTAAISTFMPKTAEPSLTGSKVLDALVEPMVDQLLEQFTDAMVKGLEGLMNQAIDDIGKWMAGGADDGFEPGPVPPSLLAELGNEPQRAPATPAPAPTGPTPSGTTGTTGTRDANLSGFRTNQYDTIIKEMAAKYRVPARLIKSVIEQESRFKPTAGSPKGARGLMQLMPGTAREVGVRNVLDPRQNIEGGTKYLARMLKMFKGDVPKALAAYNAGPGNVLKHRGIPPFRETRTYVRNIMANYNKGL